MALQDTALKGDLGEAPKFSPREVYYRRLLAELLSDSATSAGEALQNSCLRALAAPLATEGAPGNETSPPGEWSKPEAGYYDIIDAAFAAKAAGTSQWSQGDAQWQLPRAPARQDRPDELSHGAAEEDSLERRAASTPPPPVDVAADQSHAAEIEEDEPIEDDDSYVPPGYPGHEEWQERQRQKMQAYTGGDDGGNASDCPRDVDGNEDSGALPAGSTTVDLQGEEAPTGDAIRSSTSQDAPSFAVEDDHGAPVLLEAILAAAQTTWEEDSDEVEDEWRDDMDPGYVIVPISEEEFFDLEEGARASKGKGRASLRDEDGDSTVYDPLSTASDDCGTHCQAGSTLGCFQLKVIHDPFSTGFEETSEHVPRVGEVIAGRYEVEELLGSAAFSVAVRCKDLAVDTELADAKIWQAYGGAAPDERHSSVCLKMVKNNKDFFDQSLDEIKLLQRLNAAGDPDERRILTLLDTFYYREHLFLVTEVLRENLYEFNKYIRESGSKKYFTIPRLCHVTRQTLTALEFLHSLGIMHCDIKPENILIESYSRVKVKLIDFGSSCYTTDRLSSYVQSRSYRAPEVCLGLPYDGRIDIWSLGAMLAELLTGYVLFQNDGIPSMLARISSICGKFPDDMIRRGTDSARYFSGYNIIYERTESASKAVLLLYRKKTSLRQRLHLSSKPEQEADSLAQEDQELFLACLKRMLSIDPVKRPTAAQLLADEWIVRGIAQEEAGRDLTYLIEDQSTDSYQDDADCEGSTSSPQQ